MKKIVASVGLVALGASGVQTACAQDLGGPDTSKPWNVAATLRGFYDDNPGSLPNSDPAKKDIFGFEISPSAAVTWTLQQTTINLGMLYSYKYYDTIPPGSTGHDDQAFTFNAGVTHSFSETLKARVNDSFVIGQEPDLLRSGNTFSTFQRVSGDNIRNYGSVGLDDQITPKIGLSAGYDNSYYDYKASGATLGSTIFDPVVGFVQPVEASLSGLLDRIEQRAHVEGTYLIAPETKGILGYQFTDVGYTGDEYVGGAVDLSGTTGFGLQKSDFRNTRQHTFYAGAEHTFTPEFSASVRAGASYTDYYNDPNTSSGWTPYVSLTAKYAFTPESYVQGGFSYDRSATDLIGLFGTGAGLTTDAESAVLFASLNHRILPRLYGSLLAQFQNSTYNGGSYHNQSEQFYLLGLNLEYRFNAYFAADLGYNYDDLASGLTSSSGSSRGFDRNRVYIGVTATY